MTNTNYRQIAQTNSELQQAYLNDKTPANWDAYVKHSDEVFQSAYVEHSQAQMQQQLDDGLISEAEWSQIVN